MPKPSLRIELTGRLVALVLACGAVLPACEDSATTATLGTLEADSIAGDASLAKDTGAAQDTGADQTQTQDSEADLPLQDGQPDATPDVAADVQPDQVADTAKDVQPDAQPDIAPDVAPDVPPDTATDPCQPKLVKYQTLQDSAAKCTTPFDCFAPAPVSLNCPKCGVFYNGKSADVQNLIDYNAELAAAKCNGVCQSQCPDASKQVGVCGSGTCQTKELTCKELDQAASLALAEGAKCSKDSDCTFKVSNTLGCGCPTFVNMTTMGPSKPLFLYMKMLVLAYKAKVCTADTTCACTDPSSAKCVAGVCVGQ
ncbi:MAG: hypothetical protein HY902_18935 [Deltaproteobacteria bacterium]|nr:hypothetical protein [Deltaproteobacteria bacterium]